MKLMIRIVRTTWHAKAEHKDVEIDGSEISYWEPPAGWQVAVVAVNGNQGKGLPDWES
jgi:hypothetical protein